MDTSTSRGRARRPSAPSRLTALAALAWALSPAAQAAGPEVGRAAETPPATVAGDDRQGLAEARSLLASGRLAEAEEVYSRLLEAAPGLRDARLGRAFVRSFARRFAGAREDFGAVLAASPGDLEALTGLGYALAWSGAHDEAEQTFRRALAVAPGQPDAAKGLAYTSLWRGDMVEAARRFESAARLQPASAEIQVGLGRALLAQGRAGAAREAFSRALLAEPGRDDARRGLADVGGDPWRIDATLFGSLTDLGPKREPGLRFAELAFSPGSEARFWLQLDDSLSLDNLGLVQQGQRAPSYYAGGLLIWGGRFSSRLEAGYRQLPDGAGSVGQILLRGEQAVAVGDTAALKLGGWAGFRQDGRTELLINGGASWAIGPQLRLEPMLFVGRSGVPGDLDLRGQVALGWRLPIGADLAGGLTAGRTFSRSPSAEGFPAGAFLRAGLPLGSHLRGQLLLQRDWPAVGQATTVLALGLTFTVGGRP